MRIAWLIEFRNGSYFQGLYAERGGRAETAQRFGTAETAYWFMRQHEWILPYGSVMRRFDDLPPLPPNGIRVVHVSDKGMWEHGTRSEFPRWIRVTVEPTRIRVCRGSRR